MVLKFVENKIHWLIGFNEGLLYRSGEKKYMRFNNGKKYEIERSEYLETKFWDNYEKILPRLENEDETCVKLKNGHILCCGFRNFFFQWFDTNGDLVRKREDIGDDSVYGFDSDSMGNLWYVMPTINTLSQFSLEENCILYNFNKLNFPENIRIYDDIAYISDMGSKRILTFDIKTHQFQEYMKFKEPVWEYIRVGSEEYVILDSGLYLIK